MDKPHHGRIANWYKFELMTKEKGTKNYVLIGHFLDHPTLGKNEALSHTSAVLKYDEATGEIETRNSRYKLEGDSIK